MGDYEEKVRCAIAELNRLETNPETTSEQHTKAIHAMEHAVRLRDGRGTLADLFVASNPGVDEHGEWRTKECPAFLFEEGAPDWTTVDYACGSSVGCGAYECPLWNKTIAELKVIE